VRQCKSEKGVTVHLHMTPPPVYNAESTKHCFIFFYSRSLLYYLQITGFWGDFTRVCHWTPLKDFRPSDPLSQILDPLLYLVAYSAARFSEYLFFGGQTDRLSFR